jgi:hypothetical protein
VANHAMCASRNFRRVADWAIRDAGREFITRPFTPSMSLKTAIELSADWHEAVANNLEVPNAAFPAPWFPPAQIGGYEILPLEDAATLYREGHRWNAITIGPPSISSVAPATANRQTQSPPWCCVG